MIIYFSEKNSNCTFRIYFRCRTSSPRISECLTYQQNFTKCHLNRASPGVSDLSNLNTYIIYIILLYIFRGSGSQFCFLPLSIKKRILVVPVMRYMRYMFFWLCDNHFEDMDEKSIVYTFNGLYHSRSVFYQVFKLFKISQFSGSD